MDTRTAVSEEEAYELLAHLLSSAEICTFEPYYYGTFRLLDAAGRLMRCMARNGCEDRAWLEVFKAELDQKKEWMMWDRAGYFTFLSEVTGRIADELKRRDSLATGGGS